MSKYEPLRTHLEKHGQAEIPMSFEEIEAVLGFSLPASAHTHRSFWSNNPVNNVMTHAWLRAGYETESVDLERRRLVFRRVKPGGGVSPPSPPRPMNARGGLSEPPARPISGAPLPGRGTGGGPGATPAPAGKVAPADRPEVKMPPHPLFGALRGTVRFAPDLNLTAPADPDWGAHAHGDGD